MRRADVVALLDYSYWANRRTLDAAADVPLERFTAPSGGLTWRGLRGTLVHLLDVERSWRRRLRGEAPESWQASLREDDYPTPDALRDACEHDEAEMRAWLADLDDERLASVVDLGGKDRFPLWYFLMHVLTHSIQQRRDATLLLDRAGHGPGELEFLDYEDWLQRGTR